MSIDRAIVTMAVGKKYEYLLNRQRKMLKNFAEKCGAKFIPITNHLDPGNYRDILNQKLLIPSNFKDFEEVLFLDLDIHITPICPNIFEHLPESKGLGAIPAPRASEKYLRTWSDNPTVLTETVTNYYEKRGFESHPKLVNTINGGVLLFRPQLIGQTLYDHYYSNYQDDQDVLHLNHEEPALGYYSQINDLFEGLDYRFNTQVLYELKGTDPGQEIWQSYQNKPEIFKKLLRKFTGYNFMANKQYWDFVESIISKSWIVHFSAGFPIKFL